MPGASDPNPPAEAVSAGISADGQTVLFTSANELTEDANTGESGGVPNDAGSDLYSYDVASGELTDLTVDTEPADVATGADVEEVLGASPDAAYVYFVARGKLATGATSGERNLYVEHDGAIEFIATDPEPGAHFYVTPDGLHAAFTTTAPQSALRQRRLRRGLSLHLRRRDRVRLLPARRRSAQRRLPRSPAAPSPTTVPGSSSRAPTRSCPRPRAVRPTSSSTAAANPTC